MIMSRDVFIDIVFNSTNGSLVSNASTVAGYCLVVPSLAWIFAQAYSPSLGVLEVIATSPNGRRLIYAYAGDPRIYCS